MTGVQTCALPICFPVTIAGFEGIRGNPTKTITVTTNNKTFKGWVRSLKRNRAKIRLVIAS